jgi:hypothetical protein
VPFNQAKFALRIGFGSPPSPPPPAAILVDAIRRRAARHPRRPHPWAAAEAMGAHERALVLLLFSAASTGLIYVSSVYSQALKDTLDLSQDDIETISLSCYLGGLFGFLPGRVSDVMGTRRTIRARSLARSPGPGPR